MCQQKKPRNNAMTASYGMNEVLHTYVGFTSFTLTRPFAKELTPPSEENNWIFLRRWLFLLK